MQGSIEQLIEKAPKLLDSIWGDYGVWIATAVVGALLAERLIRAWKNGR